MVAAYGMLIHEYIKNVRIETMPNHDTAVSAGAENQVINQLAERKSVRVYEEQLIAQADKAAILEAAAAAPTAGCQQLYTILDITDPG